jgi:hypothetical protein
VNLVNIGGGKTYPSKLSEFAIVRWMGSWASVDDLDFDGRPGTGTGSLAILRAGAADIETLIGGSKIQCEFTENVFDLLSYLSAIVLRARGSGTVRASTFSITFATVH